MGNKKNKELDMEKDKQIFKEIKPSLNQKSNNDVNKNQPKMELNEAEKQMIESQRQEIAKIETFKRGYQKLVQETGFAWTVDGNSPLNSPKITIIKVK